MGSTEGSLGLGNRRSSGAQGRLRGSFYRSLSGGLRCSLVGLCWVETDGGSHLEVLCLGWGIKSADPEAAGSRGHLPGHLVLFRVGPPEPSFHGQSPPYELGLQAGMPWVAPEGNVAVATWCWRAAPALGWGFPEEQWLGRQGEVVLPGDRGQFTLNDQTAFLLFCPLGFLSPLSSGLSSFSNFRENASDVSLQLAAGRCRL